jgi:sugar phosphate isomerase/epimerase
VPYPLEVFTNCYHRFGLIAALEGVSRLGITKIEFSVDLMPGILDLPRTLEELDKWDPTQVDRLRNLFSRYGLTAESGFIFVENTDVEHFRLDKIKFDVAAALGLKVVDLSVTWNKPLDEAYKIFPSVLEYCSQFDFQLALELHPPLYDNAEVFWKVARDFPGYPLKANFDTANVYYYNQDPDGPAELEKVMERLGHMHLKDSYCKYHDFSFPAIGAGTVPFGKMFEVIRKHNWSGPISLEVEGIEGEVETFDGKHEVMLQSVAHLKKLGIMA